MTVPALKPGNVAFVSGDYKHGKSTFVKAWILSMGRGAIWAAPRVGDRPVEFSDVAVVVRSRAEFERAMKDAAFVVWPCPSPSIGKEEMDRQFNEFCGCCMDHLRESVVVFDELQRMTGHSKRLIDQVPNFQDFAELGHKDGLDNAKVYVAHRQAQVPLVLAAGAYRVAFKPMPGDERTTDQVFGKGSYTAMRDGYTVGDFAFWSQQTGPVLPCRLNLGG